jgi:integrase
MQFKTEADVRRLSLGDKADAIFVDDTLTGFGVRIRRLSSGEATKFVFQYRFGGKTWRLDIGDWPGMSVKAARDRAEAYRGQLMDAKLGRGQHPGAERDTIKVEARPKLQPKSLGNLVDEYLEAKREQLKPRTLVEVTRHLKETWKPLHNYQLPEIDNGLIADNLDEIAKGRGPIAANRCRATLSAFFVWAIKRRHVGANPVVATDKRKEASRERVLSDAELAAVWLACPDSDYGRIVRLLMLTGQRREEIGGLRRSEITESLDGALIALPGTRTKNGRPHDLPLSATALKILNAIPMRAGRECVFGEGEGGFAGWSRAKVSLDEKAKLKEEWTLHDLRRTAATRMSDLGVQPHIVEAVLNHVSGHKAGVAGIYNRSAYRKEKREALDLWANHLRVIVAKATGANVTKLNPKRA